MKFLRLLLKNLFRNRLRTFLTISSVAASLFLVSTLLTVLSELTSPPETPESALRLITRHKISLFNAIPYSYRQKIAAVDGVEAVIGSMWFGGIYDDQGKENQLAEFAVDSDQFFQVNADMILSPEEKEAFINDRAGAIAGRALADRFGWKVGDTIHTRSNLFPTEVELNLRGIYKGGTDEGGGLYFQWAYFNEAMNNAGFTGTYSIRVRSPEEVPAVAERVDSLFKNSTAPTKTETERAFILGFVSMLGNVQFLISSICLAVTFAVVLIAANTMAMSIRERVREIGILKALGFRRRQVLGLLLGESIFLALLGAVIGSWGARLIFSGVNLAAMTGGYLQDFNVNATTLTLCAGLGLLIGFLAAGVPAWQAAQRPVVEALRKVA
ncbi:MAG: ABC transporter permease [Acidobacteriota bacterium]